MLEIHMIALKIYHREPVLTWLQVGENIEPVEVKCQFVQINDTNYELIRRIHQETTWRHIGIYLGQSSGRLLINIQ